MRPRGLLVRLLLALVIAGVFLEPFNDWRFTPRLLQYSIPDMLSPSSGYWYLVALLFLCLWVSALPLRRADPSAGAGSPGPARRRAAEVLDVPMVSLRHLDAVQRREAAAALGIGWQRRFRHDDAAWESAYQQMLRRAAR